MHQVNSQHLVSAFIVACFGRAFSCFGVPDIVCFLRQVHDLPEILAPTPRLRISQLKFCIGTAQDGRAFLEFLLAQGPTKLSKISVQRLAPREALMEDFPGWLLEDAALCTAVLGQSRPRIVIGSANTTDERIAPFMAGRKLE